MNKPQSQRQYEAPTWSQIYRLLLDQANRIKQSGFKPDVIVGVSRGGWFPARVLSDLLENPNLVNVRAESYVSVGEARGAPQLTQCLSASVLGKRVLVVDEVAESGKSLKLVVEHVASRGASEIKTATLYFKPCCSLKPDFYARETDCWVVFPWETKETVRAIYQFHKANPGAVEAELAKLSEAGVSKRLISRFMTEISGANP